MSVIGLDLGTSGVRAVAFSLSDGAAIAAESRPLTLHRPATGTVELDAAEVIAAAEHAVAAVAERARLVGKAPRAPGFSVLGEAVVPVDVTGSPLAPVAVSMDTRGEPVARRLGERLGAARFTRITAQPLHGMFSGFKIAASASWDGAAGFRCMGDLLAQRWTGTAVIDHSQAARTGLFDVDTRVWSTEIIDELARVAPWLTLESLPAVVAGGTRLGGLTPAAADRLGLVPGVAVVAGAHDQAAAYLGGGGRPGDRSVISFGSSDCVTVGSASRPEGLEETGFASYPVDDALWVTLAGTAAGGWALEWFAQTVGRAVPEVFGALADEPPALLVLPYLAGSGTLDNDPDARGVIHGLTLETTVPQLARAVVEASGFEFAKILAALAARGIAAGALSVTGSGARNARALECRADAAGVALRPAGADSSARGAAILAARGIGLDAEPLRPVDGADDGLSEPAPQHAEWYAQQRSAYRELYDSTRALAHRLAQSQTQTSHEQENTR